MDQDALSGKLLKFYKMLGKHAVKYNLSSLKECTLKPENFILIGGGSLTLQGKLLETSDIDLLTDSKETYYCSIKTVDKEKISRTMGSTDGLYSDIFRFNYDGKFEIFSNDAAYGLSGNPDAKIPLNLEGTTIYVRPVELIIEDYNKILSHLRELNLNEKDCRITKYGERLKYLKI